MRDNPRSKMATVNGSIGKPAEGEIRESELVERAVDWTKIRKEMTCTICGNMFTEPRTIPCLHTFCKQCIESSLSVTKNLAYCPICRITLPCEILSVPINSVLGSAMW